MIQETGTPTLSWLSLSSIAVLFTTGVAWGHLRSRVKALEDNDSVPREEFNLLRDAITAIREDVREIRRKVQ